MFCLCTDIGYGYGYLLAGEIAENYQSLMKSLLGDDMVSKDSGRTSPATCRYWIKSCVP